MNIERTSNAFDALADLVPNGRALVDDPEGAAPLLEAACAELRRLLRVQAVGDQILDAAKDLTSPLLPGTLCITGVTGARLRNGITGYSLVRGARG